MEVVEWVWGPNGGQRVHLERGRMLVVCMGMMGGREEGEREDLAMPTYGLADSPR